MKKTALMLSTAVAGMMLLAPAMSTAADAAGIKFKPQVVKVKPKVAVAKPKLRVKAARVRIKPKVRIRAARVTPRVKVKVARPKVVAKVTIKPRLRAAVQIKPRVKPRLAATLKPKTVKVVPKPKPATRLAAAPKQRAGGAKLARLGNQAGLKDVMQAAQGAEAARNAAKLGKLRTGATAKLGFATPDLAPGAPRGNRDIVNGMTRKPGRNNLANNTPGGNWGDSSAARFGPESFVGLRNSHSTGPANANHGATADAARGFLGVTSGRIAAGMGQVAGDRTSSDTQGVVTVTKVEHDNGQVTHTKTENIYRGGSGGNGGQIGTIRTSHTYGVSDPTTTTTDTLEVRAFKGYRRSRESGSGWTGTDVVNNPHGSSWETGHDHTDPFELYPRERRDPDSGHGGSSPLPWINEREKQTVTISPLVVTGSPGAMPQDPGQGSTQPQQVERTVSQNDVLERYDEDGRNRGDRTPIDRSRIQSD